MKRLVATAVVLFACSAQSMELGLAEGSVTVAGTRVPIRFAYGRYATSIRSGAAQDVLILLTSRAVVPQALTEGARGDLTTLEIRLDERFRHVRTVVHGKETITLRSDAVDVKFTVASQRLIEAAVIRPGAEDLLKVSFRTLIGDANGFAPNHAASVALNEPAAVQKQTSKAVERHLELPSMTVIPGGTPLPADGGEPGRAYLAYAEAMRKDDVETMKKLMLSTMAPTTQIYKALGMKPSITAEKDVKIVNGWVLGDKATLNITGTTIESGVTGSSVVTMRKENDAWKYVTSERQLTGVDVLAAHGQQVRGIASPVKSGSPLPADGGEPGKVWRAYDRALLRDDSDALKRLVFGLESYELSKEEIAFLKEFRPTNVRLVGGVANGSKATLHLAGTPHPGAPPNGTVTLVKKKGGWMIGGGEDWSPLATK